MVQAKTFAAEIKSLRPRDCNNSDGASRLKGNSKISQLGTFLDKDGVLRVCDSYLNDGCQRKKG